MYDTNPELETVQLTPKDFDRAANLLVEAFCDNLSHVYIFADRSKRLKQLKWGLKANLKLNLTPPRNIGYSFALVEAELPSGTRQIEAMGFWHPPKCGQINPIDRIKSGWLMAPLKFGRETCQRLFEVMNAMDKTKDKVLGDRDRLVSQQYGSSKKTQGVWYWEQAS